MRRHLAPVAAALLMISSPAFSSAAEASGKRMVSLNAKTGSIDDLLDLMKTTKTGAEVVAQIAPRIQSGDLQIVALTKQVRKDYEIPRNELARFDGGTGRVYVDFTEEVGLLAPVLLHEFVHAADRELAENIKKTSDLYDARERLAAQRSAKFWMSREEGDRLQATYKKADEDYRNWKQLTSFKTERKAYDAEYAFRKELWTKIPAYFQYLNSKTPSNQIPLTERLSDEDLMRLYQLDPDVVKRGLQAEAAAAPAAVR